KTCSWVATERRPLAEALWSFEDTSRALREEALQKAVQGWIQILGPVTARSLAELLSAKPGEVFTTLIGLEVQGLVIRGSFERTAAQDDLDVEWCERRILQRIHKL